MADDDGRDERLADGAVDDLAADQRRLVSRIGRVGAWIGLVLHLFVGAIYVSSGLVAPPWALAVLSVVWGGLLAFAWTFRRSHPWWSFWTPIVALAFWYALITFGERVLGWTA